MRALPVLVLLLALPFAPTFAQVPSRPIEATATAPPRLPHDRGPSARPPSIGAKSAILVDGVDGTVLWQKDSRVRLAPASTAKILTALIVLERTKPGERVTASARAQAVGDGDALVAQLHLIAGEKLTVEQLMYGLLLPSANDAAVALAEHVARSQDRFADLMNIRARQLGATDSHFTNPHGLDQSGQYSSARDLALFARAAMRMPLFRKIVATRSHTLPGAGPTGRRVLQNRNQLLGRFSGAIGVKTGQTLASGRSLVAAAGRGKEERLAVVLSSSDPVAESQSVLEYGFVAFRRFQLGEKSRTWGHVTYGDGTTARLVALRDAGVLLGAGVQDPTVFYDARRRVLSAKPGRELRVPVRVECIPRGCRLPPDPGPTVLPSLVSVLGPLLALAR